MLLVIEGKAVAIVAEAESHVTGRALPRGILTSTASFTTVDAWALVRPVVVLLLSEADGHAGALGRLRRLGGSAAFRSAWGGRRRSGGVPHFLIRPSDELASERLRHVRRVENEIGRSDQEEALPLDLSVEDAVDLVGVEDTGVKNPEEDAFPPLDRLHVGGVVRHVLVENVHSVLVLVVVRLNVEASAAHPRARQDQLELVIVGGEHVERAGNIFGDGGSNETPVALHQHDGELVFASSDRGLAEATRDIVTRAVAPGASGEEGELAPERNVEGGSCVEIVHKEVEEMGLVSVVDSFRKPESKS